jgi:hypothetical protein
MISLVEHHSSDVLSKPKYDMYPKEEISGADDGNNRAKSGSILLRLKSFEGI